MYLVLQKKRVPTAIKLMLLGKIKTKVTHEF